MDKKQITIDTYNKDAAQLAKKFSTIGPRLKDIEFALQLAGKEKPKVFELGCGNGRDASAIVNYTDRYVGVDASENMIAYARNLVPGAQFVVADAETFTYPTNVDIVFAFASLLHFDKEAVARIFHKTQAALSERGIFYISVKAGAYQEKAIPSDSGERYFYFYSLSDMQELAGDGFELVFTDTYAFAGVDWLIVAFRKK